MIAALKLLVPMIETLPDEDQAMLVEAARMIAAERRGSYQASEDELRGIDRGLNDAVQGRFASDDKLAAALASFCAARKYANHIL
jgi:predicted transcriptional regulator